MKFGGLKGKGLLIKTWRQDNYQINKNSKFSLFSLVDSRLVFVWIQGIPRRFEVYYHKLTIWFLFHLREDCVCFLTVSSTSTTKKKSWPQYRFCYFYLSKMKLEIIFMECIDLVTNFNDKGLLSIVFEWVILLIFCSVYVIWPNHVVI